MKHFCLSVTVLLSVIFFAGCDPKDCCDNPEPQCPENLACTEIFVTISVPFQFNTSHLHQHGYSVTTLISGKKEIFRHTYTDDQFDDESYAFLANDLTMNQIKKNGSEVEYTLYDKSGKQILQESFTIGHDCCHVLKKVGKDTLTI